MGTQTHCIKRLLFEFQVEQETHAIRFHADVSNFWQARIMPILDRCLSDASEAGGTVRIDSLELDLGFIDPAILDDDMLARLEDQIRDALRKHVNATPQRGGHALVDGAVQSNLELFAVYARSGCLTWWADHAQPDPLRGALDYLLQEAPVELARLMQGLAKDDRSLTRIVLQCDDRRLSRLGALQNASQTPMLECFPRALLYSLQECAMRKFFSSRIRNPRQLVWISILRSASQTGDHSVSTLTYWRDVLVQIAQALRTRYDTLVTALYTVLPESDSKLVSKTFRDVIDRLNRELPNAETSTIVASDFESGTAITKRWAKVLRLLEDLESQAARKQPQTVKALWDLIVTLVRERLSPPAGFGDRLREFEPVLREILKPSDALGLDALLHEEASKPEARSHTEYGKAEEVYVENAGLVILWPFLERFFARLDLLGEKRFKSSVAAQRAVGLLQYLANEDPAGPEYLLPLNKVICGMMPADVFDFGVPLSEQEQEECTRLLEAIIEHATILRNMSIRGFRGTFLLRKGILDSRDGAWRLRVEKESFDVVLDHFPWSFSWIKLPWMEAPLRVEW